MKYFAGLFMILAALLFITPVYAFDGLTYYSATISDKDRYNSAGKRLTSVRDILRQDRANMHEFGLTDPGDEYESYFSKASNRNMFNNASLRISGSLANKIKGSGRVHITVYVYPGEIEVR